MKNSFLTGAKASIRPTDKVIIEATSPNNNRHCVFEDDGETGYFYALEKDASSYSMVNALLIYQYPNGNTDDRPFSLELKWSEQSHMCALVISDGLHGLFDWNNQVAYNGSGFPKGLNGWTNKDDLEAAVNSL